MEPKAGMPVTECYLNDTRAAEIIATKGTRLLVQRPGEREPRVFTRRKDGKYRQMGQQSPVLVLGKAEDYRCKEF